MAHSCSKKLIRFLMFVFVVLCLMETSLTEGRGIHGLIDRGILARRNEDIGGSIINLGNLSALLPKGTPVPPSGPSPDKN
ncbi:hypothetical protein Fmac_019292 [Flemingia macrophylla]|uniref:Uncharacterized protein n=1 Tax=Flemingia macrophylla TaxID=520843 RepID=A0ABD1M7J2_9FABA